MRNESQADSRIPALTQEIESAMAKNIGPADAEDLRRILLQCAKLALFRKGYLEDADGNAIYCDAVDWMSKMSDKNLLQLLNMLIPKPKEESTVNVQFSMKDLLRDLSSDVFIEDRFAPRLPEPDGIVYEVVPEVVDSVRQGRATSPVRSEQCTTSGPSED